MPRGKIRQAVRGGDQIPLGWALDMDGAPTTNPAAALLGVLLPMGGPKRSALLPRPGLSLSEPAQARVGGDEESGRAFPTGRNRT